MRYRKLDENGDYSFGNSQSNFMANTPETVGQAVLTRLNLWIGEWFADISDGTGWDTSVLGKGTESLFELTLRQRVLETPGVDRVTDFQATFDGDVRRLSVEITIDTVYGVAIINTASGSNA